MSIKLSKDWRLTVSETYGIRFQHTRLSFRDSGVTVFHRLSKGLDLFCSYSHSISLSKSKKAKHYHTVSGGISRSLKTDLLRVDYRVKTEYHFRSQDKFRIRILPQFRLRTRQKFAGFTPFASLRLYYYLGGEAIKQYNHAGVIMQEVAPYGFHRARLSIGSTYKVSSRLFLKLQLTSQKEFNTIFAYKHRINVLNPETGKVERPFNNYKIFGLGITYIIKPNNKFSHKKSSFDPDQVW